jgi:assimilatory nitrate reductase electron transfer subunit
MRTVVVGNGMAAVRLVEHLVARGVDAITVLGEEPYGPYNRILLSAVLEGTHRPEAIALREDGWCAAHGVTERLGTRVLGLHPGVREVELQDGSRITYEALVLATGSTPLLPAIHGLIDGDGHLHPRAHAFRGLADCTRLLAAVPTSHSAVVVGGGLLGLQVARALSVRGLRTEVVEQGEHVLGGHVDETAGRVLERSLARLGTAVYTGARVARLVDEGVVLDNGKILDADLIVLTTGCRPSTRLAVQAGLATRRGIVVDDHLATSDPHVFALGDCADPRRAGTGSWRGRPGLQSGARQLQEARRRPGRHRRGHAGRRPIARRSHHPGLRQGHGSGAGRAQRPVTGRPVRDAGRSAGCPA